MEQSSAFVAGQVMAVVAPVCIGVLLIVHGLRLRRQTNRSSGGPSVAIGAGVLLFGLITFVFLLDGGSDDDSPGSDVSDTKAAATQKPPRPSDDSESGQEYESCSAAHGAFAKLDAKIIGAARSGDIAAMASYFPKAMKDVVANRSCWPDSMVQSAERALGAGPDVYDLDGVPERCRSIAADSFELLSVVAGRYASGDETNAAKMAEGFKAIQKRAPAGCMDDDAVELLNERYKQG